MKTIVLAVLMLTCIRSVGQRVDSLRPLSNYEKFINRTGSIIKSEELVLGKTRVCRIAYLRARDLSDSNVAEAVALMGNGNNYWAGGHLLSIDKDEVHGIIKALTFYQGQIAKGQPLTTESYYFLTRNKIVTTCYFIPTGVHKGWYISLYQQYMDFPEVFPGSRVDLKERDVDEITSLLKRSLNVTW